MPPYVDRQRPYDTAMPTPTQWAYPTGTAGSVEQTADAAAAAAAAAGAVPAAPGAPTAGMSRDQVRQYLTNYYASRGVTPNPTSIDYWTDKYFSPEFNGDFEYWGRRVAAADEFTGGGGGAPAPGGAVPGGGVPGLLGGGGSYTPEQIMQMDPGYQFRLGQGLQGLQRLAAAKGTLLTGGTQKALERYAQDYASGEFQNVFNRNYQVGELGYNAAKTAGLFGSDYARNTVDLITGNANAQAGGSLAQGNVWGQLPSQLAGLWEYYRQQRQPTTRDPGMQQG